MRAALLLSLALAAPTGAQDTAVSSAPASAVGKVRRGTMKFLVHVQGTVRPEQVYRLKSTIDGRIESVDKKPNTWADERDPIGTLLTKEMAAMADSNATTPSAVLEERWQRVFQPIDIACPGRCFVVKVYAQPGTQVKAGTLLAEAAGKLRLVGRVKPGDTQWVREGQTVRFWSKKDPTRRQTAKVERFVRDVQGQRIIPGGTFTVLLTPEAWLDANTEWEGVIEAEVKKDVLSVPTQAILVLDGEAFLPIRVSTGVSTYDETEIVAGIGEGVRFLTVDPAATDLQRHIPPPETLERFELEEGRKKRRPERERDDADLRPAPRTSIAPERWEINRRSKRKAGAIDVFPDDRPRGERDDRYPSDFR
ncbi:MAG: HlyD family secretion protein [Elusimicrobia bacterium]|nr:HlyD family secretion protein [Elusimicrobiota bacterium]